MKRPGNKNKNISISYNLIISGYYSHAIIKKRRHYAERRQ